MSSKIIKNRVIAYMSKPEAREFHAFDLAFYAAYPFCVKVTDSIHERYYNAVWDLLAEGVIAQRDNERFYLTSSKVGA